MKRILLLFSLWAIISSATFATSISCFEPYTFGHSGTQLLLVQASDLTEDIAYETSGLDASFFSLSY